MVSLLLVFLTGCQSIKGQADASDHALVKATMQKHLNAVSKKDLKALRSTLSPEGQMQLILPGQEIIDTVAGFMDFHQTWFAQPDWTFETQIINIEAGKQLAMAVVQIIYREPMRDGKPYFNRMTVSYDLKKIGGQWYVIKDHASSVTKSTDP